MIALSESAKWDLVVETNQDISMFVLHARIDFCMLSVKFCVFLYE